MANLSKTSSASVLCAFATTFTALAVQFDPQTAYLLSMLVMVVGTDLKFKL
ncbi:hypothetical protein [Acinetobacter tandoii]